ncbi:TPA: DUF2591 domain-containing protein [Enterobacter cloacae]|uniref:phage protein NinX family protein n=1 Tax=Enterobacter cloacae TaxID=550 RepID=UPI000BE704BF|nr:phage protein NinX family protein [Enterobacter cloacae]MDE7904161.1 DUF2591 domain-containing protein [Enterobacter cloacae]MDK9968700.1 DUF2591 domain-containing protein [Enterobacter cloacae]MDK9973785.1 DUF2591 domain-containing protein [Enterobacter cloacae]MDL0011493.1 DUF2591 domain-containing protein [Enterobacter cloacae]PDQ12546.1 hypothetical protein CKK21_24610 [Enterobacter cloacae]
MDYSQLSDFEINKRVAIALNIDMHFFIPESENSFDLEVLPSEMGPIWQTSADMVLQYRPSNGNSFNPCNNPADAWPIIESNRISIRNRYEGDWKAENEWGESRFHVACNPLRAAMIVFLMMQESNHA